MPRFLHVLCGNKHKDQTTKLFASDSWEEVRLDPHRENNPDILGTFLEMDEVATGEFDAVYVSHTLERLYPHQVITALANLHRVLKDDGYLIITCADLQATCQLIAENKLLEPAYESPAGPVSPLDILFGYRPALAAGLNEFANHCGFTSKALIGTLAQAGFVSLWSARNPEILTIGAIATKQETNEEAMKKLAEEHFSN